MEQFATEEQQVEAIKKFWKENGPAIIIGAVIGLGGLWGWRYYNEQQIAEKEQASIGYESAVSDLQTDPQALEGARAFAKEHADSGYAVLTALQLAKQAVDQGDIDKAIDQLKFAIEQSDETAMRNIARLRLARIFVHQDSLDEAMAILDEVEAEAFMTQVQELKGDIYVKQSLLDKARAAYSAVLQENQNNYVVKMKLDSLAARNG